MDKTKKVIAIITLVVLVVIAALAITCSLQEQKPEVNMNLDEAKRYTLEEIHGVQIEVVDSGYTVEPLNISEDENPDAASVTVDYAFVVENHNSGYAAQYIPFTVNGYGENGIVLFTGGANVQYVYPGIQTAVSGSTTMPLLNRQVPEIVDFEVEPVANTIDWMAIGMTDDEVKSLFTIVDESAEKTDAGVTVKATITGNIEDGEKLFSTTILENTLEGHAVTIFYDAEGKIVYGSGSKNVIIDEASQIMADLEGSNDSYNITLGNVPEYSSFKVFVMPGLY